MTSLSKIFSIIFISLVFSSCYYDVEEELYPTVGGCDTSNVSLSLKVRPIIEGSCFACHSAKNANSTGGSIDLETYANLKVQVDNGKLIKSINHESGVSPMPKGSSSKIDACEISIIEKWVLNGAKND